MPFYHIRETPYRQKRKGVQIKTILSGHIQTTFIQLVPGFVSSHKHPEEQMGYILSGEIELVIDQERMKCFAGDGYLIPSGTLHSFRVLSKQPVELLEVFSPPKEENMI